VKPGYHIFVPYTSFHSSTQKFVGYFPESLQAKLGEHLAKRRLDFAPGRTSIAIHARRGDLPKGDERATSDAYYFRLLHAIRKVTPDADVHLWSSTATVYWKNKTWTFEDFDDFRDHGVTVHLDDEDMLEAWAHMARADVLVTSMSHFSFAPAVLNPNCIVYPGSIRYLGERPAELPPNWINALDIEGLRPAADRIVPVGEDREDRALLFELEELEGHLPFRGRISDAELAKLDRVQVLPNGEIRFAFDHASNASAFQQQLRRCLRRALRIIA